MTAAKATGIEWCDPSLGPKEGKTHQAMLDRREAISRHVAAGGEQPRNVDPIEAKHAREQTEKRRAFVPKCLSEAALAGKPADKTLPAGTAPQSWSHKPDCDGWKASERAQGLVECTGCADEPIPLTVDEIARRGRIGQALELFSALSDDDQRVWLRMLRDGGAYETLLARCHVITDEGRGPALNPDGSLPSNPMIATPREHTALARLLGTVNDYRRLLLPHPSGCACKSCKAAP